MLFVTEYKLKPTMTRDQSRELMDLFGKDPQAQGELAHYVRVDGSGGYLIIDTDDPAALYPRVLAFDPYMDITIVPIMKVEDAVGPILQSLAD